MLPPADAKDLSHFDVIVQPDGDFTYVLMGDDTHEMARVMAEHKKNEPGAFFAKPVHNDKVIAAGFVTLAYVAHSLERRAKQAELSKAVAATPQRGETPISFSSTVAPGTARVDVEVPATVFSDAAAAAAAAGPALKGVLAP